MLDSGPKRNLLETIGRLVALGEPLWMILVGASVYLFLYLSYLNKVGFYLSWLGLVVASVPLLWRLARHGYRSARTPFDLPWGLLLLGAAIGVAVSPERAMSLRAFQSLLLVMLAYYSFVHYSRPAALLKSMLPVAGVSIIAVTVVAFNYTSLDSLDYRLPGRILDLAYLIPWLPRSPQHARLDFHLNYGMALAMLIALAFCIGFAVFGRRGWLRWGMRALGVPLALLIVALNYFGISRLVSAESIATRLPLWRLTLHMLAESPIAGLGLGAWPTVADKLSAPFVFSHPHSSYLQLYSDAGILGVGALVASWVVSVRLGGDVLRSSRANPWYGLGVGTLLAGLITALFGVLEKAPIGFYAFGPDSYFYAASPLPALLATALVIAHRLLVGAESSTMKEGPRTGKPAGICSLMTGRTGPQT